MAGFGGQCSGEELTEQLSYQYGAEGYCMYALTTSYIHNVKRKFFMLFSQNNFC